MIPVMGACPLHPSRTEEHFMLDLPTLHERLSAFDAIAAVSDNLPLGLVADEQLGRFRVHRGYDGTRRENQIPIDFLFDTAGRPLLDTGRGVTMSHQGWLPNKSNGTICIGRLETTPDEFSTPDTVRVDVLGCIDSLKAEALQAQLASVARSERRRRSSASIKP
ncbi:MAG: group I truncated hemoglobin [Planctomycetota bacterium]